MIISLSFLRSAPEHPPLRVFHVFTASSSELNGTDDSGLKEHAEFEHLTLHPLSQSLQYISAGSPQKGQRSRRGLRPT